MGKSSDLYLVEQILDLSISEETMMTSIKNGLAPVSLTIIYGVFFSIVILFCGVTAGSFDRMTFPRSTLF